MIYIYTHTHTFYCRYETYLKFIATCGREEGFEVFMCERERERERKREREREREVY
jgi:hypothetical protein